MQIFTFSPSGKITTTENGKTKQATHTDVTLAIRRKAIQQTQRNN